MPNFHFIPDGMLLLVSTAALWQLDRMLGEKSFFHSQLRRRTALRLAMAAAAGIYTIGYLLNYGRVSGHFPVDWVTWTQGAALVLAMLTTGICGAMLAARALTRLGGARPAAARDAGAGVSRRVFWQAARGSLLVAPVAGTAFGLIHRNDIGLTETDIAIAGLPAGLDGLRIAQVSDIHLSAFLSEAELARAVDMVNELRPHLTLVTGDLITRPGDPLEACLRQLARLRADAGVIGCLGNHEIYAGIEDLVTEAGARIGIDFLRMQSRLLRFGGTALNFAGVDYQRRSHPYLRGAERMVEPGCLNILLSHNPDVFPVAARQGYDLTIAGHTHGGQVNVEILNDNLNVARFFTRYTRGLYREGGAAVFVSSGIGTVGLPVRLGAPAEVNLIRLRAGGPPVRASRGAKEPCGA